MKAIPFAKVQSIGNDFVLLDLDQIGDRHDLPELAKAMCARRFGIGSDGLLTISARGAELAMRMFNPDGTEDFCGNGMRCGAWYAHSRGLIAKEFTILHGGRRVHTYVASDASVCTTLGPASFAPAEIPVRSDDPLIDFPIEVAGEVVRITAVTTGSTHAVVMVDALPDDERFVRVSSALEHHPLFPERTSVIWTRVAAPDELQLRIWERGVGETLGCGTGSSAAVAVQVERTGRVGRYRVHNPGGMLSVRLEERGGDLNVKSDAEVVYEGDWLLS